MAQPTTEAAVTPESGVGELEKLLRRAKASRGGFEPVWYLNMAYYMGRQWVFWNRGRLDRPLLEPWRVTLTDNRIIGIVRTDVARMTKQKPAFTVVPVTSETADMEASRTGEQILNYLWRHLSLRKRLMETLRWSRVTGAGFWKIYWDSGKGERVTIACDPEGNPVLHAETGAPMRPDDFDEGLPEGVSTKTICTGDVAVETVSPFEMYFDPLALKIEEAEWCIQVAVKSPEWVKARFGIDLPADTDIASGVAEGKLFAGPSGGANSGRGVKVSEYWAKPSTKYPKGRRAVWTANRMLLDEPNPYGELPYVMFEDIEVPGRFWPTSTVEQLREPQTELNKVRSQITDNAQRLGNPALLAAKQANVEYEGVPGERIDYDDTVPNAIPSYLEPPSMPPYVLQQQERIEQSMQEISGQHEVSSAQVPAGVTAASAINLLQEADDTRLGPAIYDMEETLGIAGTRLLELVAKYWTDARIVMIAGDDQAWTTMSFRGDALKENTHVEVQAGSAFPRSKAAKQAAIQQALNLALQYSQPGSLNPRDLAKVLRDMEAGALEKLFGDLTADVTQVNRENVQLARGERFPVNPYDNHQAHIDGHTEMQKGSSYQMLSPEVQQGIELHVAEHRTRLLQAMGPPAAPSVTPAETLNYKDAPPDIQRQIEAQAGMTPSTEQPAQEAPANGASEAPTPGGQRPEAQPNSPPTPSS
jgi:hypothetical protein